MNVVIYARYSSHSQTEQSIEGQIAVCTEYAKRNNYTIVGEYIDRALTGTNDNRPQFKKMIEDSNKKFFQGVLVYQLDRFARNRFDSATYKNKLKKNGVRVFSAKENISDDASGILMESVLEGMAEYYSAELSQKVKRGMKINAEKCLFNGGTVPLGFVIDKDKKFQIDEENAFIVKKIFDMYKNDYTMTDIIKYLNDINIKTCLGNKFNKNSIRNMLINKRYIGVYTYNGIEIEHGIPQIIDNETFNIVQEKMQKNKKMRSHSKAKEEYLLTTKLFCGHCKELMVGVSGTSKNKTTHFYYSCNGIRKKICNKKSVQKDYIEDFVIKQAHSQLTDENIDRIAKAVEKLVKSAENSNNLKILNKRLKDNQKQKENLFNSLKICEFDNVKKSIFEEINKLEQEQQNIEREILLEKIENIEMTYADVTFFLNLLKKGDINDIRYRKALINIFIDKIYLYDNNDIIIMFNLQNNVYRGKLPKIEDLECSFLGKEGSPEKDNTNTIYYLGGFAIKSRLCKSILL